jgi:hypothetical protein
MKRTKEDGTEHLELTPVKAKIESAEDFAAAEAALHSVQKQIGEIEHNRDVLKARLFLAEPTPADPSDLIDENKVKRWINASLWKWAANQSYFSVEWSGGALDVVGELRGLLFPIAALQEYGTSAKIAEQIGDFRRVIEKLGDEAPPVLEETVADLERTRAAMAKAEKILADAGWKFDLKTRKAKRDEKRDAEHFFAACVRAAYKAKRMKRGNSKLVREKIAATLAPWFDNDDGELSPDSGKPIYMAIYKMRNAPP